MPSAQELQQQFGEYRGAMPRPSDFDLFWKDRMAEADAIELDYAIEAASVADSATCRFFDLWYTGMCGARLHAKYLKPVSEEPMPLVLQFHGYPGASRSWFEQASFAGMGPWHSSLSIVLARVVPPRILVDLRARRSRPYRRRYRRRPGQPLLCPPTSGYPHSVPYRSRARGHRSCPRICERRIAGRRFGYCDLRAQ